MKWLHLSDLHYNPKEDGTASRKLRNSLPDYLESMNIIVDQIFITGDFRLATQPNTDETAKEVVDYILKIAKAVGVKEAKCIHIVPGNHDLDLQQEDYKKAREKIVKRLRKEYTSTQGKFVEEQLSVLWEGFSFFQRICQFLYKDNTDFIWNDMLSPVCVFCDEQYNYLYLNSAITCIIKEDRGNLLIGTEYLLEALENIKETHPNLPTIVLSHHGIEEFKKREREAMQIFFKENNIILYFCGDSHELWLEKIDNMYQITMGCIKYANEVQATFGIGELAENKINLKSYKWDEHSWGWGEYTQFNKQFPLESEMQSIYNDLKNKKFEPYRNLQYKDKDLISYNALEIFKIIYKKFYPNINSTFIFRNDTLFLVGRCIPFFIEKGLMKEETSFGNNSKYSFTDLGIKFYAKYCL